MEPFFRVATEDDWPQIWPIFHAVVSTGDTYPYLPATTEGEARSIWMQPNQGGRFTYVADVDGDVAATAYLKPNQPGLGDHVCNAGWMVSPQKTGQGVGRRFAEYVLDQARDEGFSAMQFNAVVSTNERAVGLWKSLGFEIVGTVPDAFRHSGEGLTSIHVMHRQL